MGKRNRGDEMEVRNTKILRISEDGVIPTRKQQRKTQYLHAGFFTDWLETVSSFGSDDEDKSSHAAQRETLVPKATITNLPIPGPGDSADLEKEVVESEEKEARLRTAPVLG